MKRRALMILLTTALVICLLPRASASVNAASDHRHYRMVCATPAARHASCRSEVVTDSSGTPIAGPNLLSGSYGNVQFHTAYNLPCMPGGAVQSTCSAPSSYDTAPIIGIVDAYADPTVETDLGTFDTHYGLPACTRSNGCLIVVNQTGGTTLPSTDGGWALEISLDVQTAHDICQTCRIALVEANTASMNDLAAGVNEAAKLGASAISNSYGGGEWSGESAFDTSSGNPSGYYGHPGIAVVASSGDTGNAVGYPASSPDVIAVGGTTLNLNGDSTYNIETVWNSDGSGCSQYEPATSWQLAVSTWSQTGCGTLKGTADVSADANPNTGAAVYDGTAYSGQTGWFQVGGTSLSSPLIAGVIALAGGAAGVTNPASIPYLDYNAANSHDITSGSNGTCGTIMCNAAIGYDGPTGIGSPNGTAGFGGSLSGGSNPTTGPTSTVTKTASTGPSNTSLPTSTSQPTTTATQLIANGGFESGSSPWQESSSNGYQLVSPYRVHSGSNAAWFCGYASCKDQLSQTVAMPSSLTKLTLTYWYYSDTGKAAGSTCTDHFTAQLKSGGGAVITIPQTSCNTSVTNGWVQESFDLTSALSPYAGQSIILAFQGTTNSSTATSDFFLDDVTLTATSGGASPPPPTATNTTVPPATATATSIPAATATNTPLPAATTNTPLPTPTTTPVATPTNTSVSTAPKQLIANGGFESGSTGWQESSAQNYQLISSYKVHTGSDAAWLCGYGSCNDQLSQTVTLPSSLAKLTLSYWYDSDTHKAAGSTCTDKFSTRIKTTGGTIITTPQTSCNSSVTNGWVQETFDLASALTPYVGQSVMLSFQGTTNSSTATSDFFLDDVSLTVS